MSQLTIQDILSCENTGFGFVGHNVRNPAAWSTAADPYACIRAVDESVLRAANLRRMTREQLHTFMQSRPGRHLGDFLSDNLAATQAVLVSEILPFFEWAERE